MCCMHFGSIWPWARCGLLYVVRPMLLNMRAVASDRIVKEGLNCDASAQVDLVRVEDDAARFFAMVMPKE